MKTVATFSTPGEAYLFQSHLAGSGIESYVRDDNTVIADVGLSTAIGGVKVDVADSDYEQAKDLFDETIGTDIEIAKAKNQKRYAFSRYVKIALATASVVFIYSLFTATLTYPSDYIPILSLSLGAGLCVGLLCGLLDI